MRYLKLMGAVLFSGVFLAGCHQKKAPDTSNFKSAIDGYYSARPACVWTDPVKFPSQADATNEDQTKGFDALTDAGLLTRTPEQKKRFLVGSKRVNDYDLSDKGRSTWTADQTQPGYGNFCYGHRQVTAITGYTEGNANGAKTETVSYNYDFTGVPDWAKAQETKSAFPKLAANLSGQMTDQATLVDTSNGWQVSHP